MIIMGIDPGIERCGFAVLDCTNGKTILRDCGCIRTSKKLTLSERLATLYDDLCSVIREWKPQTAAVEELFFSKNVSTGMMVSHARGVILLALEKNEVSMRAFNPGLIKQALTGEVRADKKQMQKMVQYELGITLKNDDTVDAIAIALCMKAHLKRL